MLISVEYKFFLNKHTFFYMKKLVDMTNKLMFMR